MKPWILLHKTLHGYVLKKGLRGCEENAVNDHSGYQCKICTSSGLKDGVIFFSFLYFFG